MRADLLMKPYQPKEIVLMFNATAHEFLMNSAALFLADCGAKMKRAGARVHAMSQKLMTDASLPRPSAPSVAAALLLLASAHPAAAQVAGGTGGSGSLETFLTNIVNEITGTAGQCLAVIAVALSGIGAMFGAMSARAFGGVILGCAIVFSAAWVVGKITGNTISG